MNKHVIRRLSDVFSSLHTPFTLFDAKGRLLFGSLHQTVQPPLHLPADQPFASQGAIFLSVASAGGLLLMTPDSPAATDSIMLAAAMVKAIYHAEAATNNEGELLRRLLLGKSTVTEMEAFSKERKIQWESPRCVMLMCMIEGTHLSAAELLGNVLPLDPGDRLVAMDRYTAALIKVNNANTPVAELTDFASAVQETLLSEEGISLTIGIGGIVLKLSDIPASYAQARQALNIGRAFRPHESIYPFQSMLVERFLSDIPKETAAKYRALLFNRKTARLFSDEMVDTINMFLRKNLNLADTSRQMYIHRNTLVYRLDKVQKQTGLDLRRFDDALTFKLLYEMKKCAELD